MQGIANGLVDPDLADALPQLQEVAKPLSLSTLAQRRLMVSHASELIQRRLQRSKSLTWTDISLTHDNDEGPSLLVVRRTHGASGLRPALYYFHGGGLVMGNSRLGIGTLLDYVIKFDIILVSLDYRLAPEHQFPAAHEDGYQGLNWLHEHGAEFGIDPNSIILAGSSAGGGLAASTALFARDHDGPALLGQLLFAPMLDDRTSLTHHESAPTTWDAHSNQIGWTATLGSQFRTKEVPIYAAPGRAENLSSLPPTYIDVGDIDLFAKEVLSFAKKLMDAQVPVEMHIWPGCYHAFDQLVPQARASRTARRARQTYLERLLTSAKS